MQRIIAGLVALATVAASTGLADLCLCHGRAAAAPVREAEAESAHACCAAAAASEGAVDDAAPALAGRCPRGCCTARIHDPRVRDDGRRKPAAPPRADTPVMASSLGAALALPSLPARSGVAALGERGPPLELQRRRLARLARLALWRC